ncbi:MAG: 50S ribosomal protein L23 [Verrucomicrobiota bacterium]|nr:50S ribosomal protein L23 [Verrucomicrobiota bacterium]
MKELSTVIRRIQVTEKGSGLTKKQSKYFFRVHPAANKIEIARAVEKMFKVAVVKVNTMNYLGKEKRSRKMARGKKSDWKRAVVTLKPGDKIDLA